MMRVARSFLAVLVVLLALGIPTLPVAAQDGGVGFEDMPGLQSAVTRTFNGEIALDPTAPAPSLRGHLKPNVALMLVGIFAFDTEANATAAWELLQTDMNATGMQGQPLPLTEISLPLDLEHAAASAVDDTGTPEWDFTLVLAVDGTLVYTVIGITSGAPPEPGVTAILRSMGTSGQSAAPVSFSAGGTSTGGLWDSIPSQASMTRHFRGITSVVDATPFPV